MKFTWSHIIGFFATLALLGGLLYPRTVFLGMIYEGAQDLHAAEMFYQQYLTRHPHDRFTTLRLAGLYTRMAEPDRATPLLRALSQFRRRDWDVAMHYIAHLEERHADMELLAARVDIAHQFRTARGIDHRQRIGLLEAALEQALWMQLDELADGLLDELLALHPDDLNLQEWQYSRALGQQQTERVIAFLSDNIAQMPTNIVRREELLEVYAALGRWEEVREIASRGLTLDAEHGGLLMRRAQANERLGATADAIADYEHALQSNPNQELPGLIERLVTLYRATGRGAEALQLLTQRLADDPTNRDIWLQGIELLRGSRDAAVRREWLAKARAQFPQDAGLRADLAHTLLYDAHDTTAVPFYAEYVAATHDVGFALDVAYALQAQRSAQYSAWLRQAAAWFPDNVALRTLRADDAERRGDWRTAIQLLQHLPLTPARMRHVADLYGRLGEWDHATNWLLRVPATQRTLSDWDALLRTAQASRRGDILDTFVTWLTAQSPQRAELWLAASDILVHRTACAAALPALQRTLEPTPHAPGRYLRYQCLQAVGDSAAAVRLARGAPMRAAAWPTVAAARIDTTLAAAAAPHRARALFAAARQQFPSDLPLAIAEVDTLIDAQQLRAAHTAMTLLRADDRATTEQPRLEARLALAGGDCAAALPQWHALRTQFPNDRAIAQSAADCALAAGDLRGGLAGYAALVADTAAAPQQRLLLQRRLGELHRQFDAQVGFDVKRHVVGSDRATHTRVDFRSPLLARRWRVHSSVDTGWYDAGTGTDLTLTQHRTLATVLLRPWFTLGTGLWTGGSAARTRVAPLVTVGADWRQRGQWQFAYAGGRLRDNLSAAVAAGSVQHTIDTTLAWQWTQRLRSSVQYQWVADTSAAGNHATTHLVQPMLTWQWHTDPDVSIGYAYVFGNTDSPDAYLSEVPLIPRTRAHYVVANAAIPIGATARFTLDALLGHDPGRDLRFTRGDLFGIDAGLRWDFARHWTANTQLHLDRSHAFDTTAVGTEWHVGVTAHW